MTNMTLDEALEVLRGCADWETERLALAKVFAAVECVWQMEEMQGVLCWVEPEVATAEGDRWACIPFPDEKNPRYFFGDTPQTAVQAAYEVFKKERDDE